MVKWGNVRYLNPNGHRLPSTICCPTQADICEMLMNEPLEPATTICLTLLSALRERSALRPDESRAWLSARVTFDSNDSRTVIPGSGSSRSSCAIVMIRSTSRLAVSMKPVIVSIVPLSGTVSPIPIEKPLWSNQKLTVFCTPENQSRHTSWPFSR